MPVLSLKTLFVRRWMAFAACVALLFAVSGLLLLFVLEDSFIDRQLGAATRSVATASPGVAPLPAEFSVYPIDEVPLDIHARLPFAAVGKPFEMRRADRRHAHVQVVDTPDRGQLVVVYDVTDQLAVTPHLGAGLLILIGLMAMILLAAAALARAFVGRVTRQASQLIEEVRGTSDPQRIRELAQAQQILELRQLLDLHADVREAQLAALENERQLLAHLAHELRTPLQSAQTSLAVLHASCGDEAAYARVVRAITRLSRSTQAALWLATDRAPDLTRIQQMLPLLRSLVDELNPLARSVGRTINIDLPEDLSFHGPVEIAEAILANLLLNAVQHGSGSVQIESAIDGIVITNPTSGYTDAQGFGLGLEIVQRLAQRLGWRVERLPDAEHVRMRIRFV